MKEKVLIIGGSRFVGPYLLDLLQKDGCEITVFNRGNRENKYKNAKFVQGNRNENFSELKSQHYDTVYDMCAYNGEQTKKLIDEVKFDFLVHFGSIASYAKPQVFPVKEDQPTGEWFWGDYGRGKAECEEVLAASNISYASLRPTYILGAANFIDREKFIYGYLKNGKAIHIPGNGRALVQFVFVDEVAEALHLLGTKRLGGGFNCVGNECVTLIDLVTGMAGICGGKVNIKLDRPDENGGLDNELFPFANENGVFDNTKLKEAGIKFAPLFERLKKDWITFYSKSLG
jgi:nucleoside-diphosphate-sugar epimerase